MMTRSEQAFVVMAFVSASPDGPPPRPVLRGWATGEGVYETFLWRGRLPESWPHHVARLRRGAQRLELPWPGDLDVGEAILTALRGHGGAASPWRVRASLLATGPGTAFQPCDQVALVIEARPATVAELQPAPARLVLGGAVRNPASLLAGCKKLGIAEDALWRRRAQSQGADDALLCSTDGFVSEATTSTLLAGLRDGRIVTPAAAAAPVAGTTLLALSERVATLGGCIEPVLLRPADLASLRWALLLNAVWGGRPVATLEGRTLEETPRDLAARVRSCVA